MIHGTLRRSHLRRLNQLLTICITILVVAGMVAVWVRVVQTLKEPSGGPKTIGQPGALVWDTRVFTSPGQLKSYLSSKGRSYSRWVARHPTAFGATAPAVTKHPTKHPTTKHTTKPKTTAKTTAKPKPKPAARHVAAPQTIGDTKARPLASLVLTILLLIAGIVLGGSAVLPPRYAPASVQYFYAAPDRRTVALAAATAILLGLGVSFYLT